MKERTLSLVLAMILVSSLALAGESAYAPTITGGTGLFSLFSGSTLPDGEWSFGLYYNNWDRVAAPVPMSEPRIGGDFGYDHTRLSASLAYGVTDKFELSLMLPYEDLYEGPRGNRLGRINGKTFARGVDISGLGNLRLGGKWKLQEDTDALTALALNAFVDLPTGEDEDGVVTGGTGLGVGINWHKANWVLNGGYYDPGDADEADVASQLIAGIGYAKPVGDRLDWITELAATFYSGGANPAPDDTYDLTSGVRYWFGEDGNWAFNIALRADLNLIDADINDEFCPFGGLVGLTYLPRFGKKMEAPAPAPEPAPIPVAPVVEPEAVEPAPAPTPPPAAPVAPPEEREVVNFDFDSARLSNIAKAKLDEVGLKLQQSSDAVVLVVGHTDSIASEAYNLQLSDKRANAVKDYLVSRHQIDPSRITIEGRGEAEPVAGNDTADGRAMNRRSVIIIKLQ